MVVSICPDTFVTERYAICPCQSLFWSEIDRCPTIILWSISTSAWTLVYTCMYMYTNTQNTNTDASGLISFALLMLYSNIICCGYQYNASTWILKHFYYHISASCLCCLQLQWNLPSMGQWSVATIGKWLWSQPLLKKSPPAQHNTPHITWHNTLRLWDSIWCAIYKCGSHG